ncbi:ScyD/ScyE family protein [Micromonosporaceae bacterium Da 78-11]
MNTEGVEMRTKRSVLAAVVAVGALLPGASPARADGRPPPWPLAAGLADPRGLALGPDGLLRVAEAGRAGSGPCPAAGPGGGNVCFGRPATVTRIADGRQRRVVRYLPSAAAPPGIRTSGFSDVAVDKQGRVYFTVGLGGSPDLRTQLRALTGTAELDRIRRLGPSAGPGAGANPNSVLAVRDGELIADAGGNSLVRLGPRGRMTTVATFPPRMVPFPAGFAGGPSPGTLIAMPAVPTAVVRGPDGALYVGELTGFPFPAGRARVWRVVPGHPPTVYAAGFTTVIDLAWGPDRELYVLEIAHRGLLSGDRTGALLRAGRHGQHRVIASTGLTAPGGLVVRGHYAYVSNCSVCRVPGSVRRISLR